MSTLKPDFPYGTSPEEKSLYELVSEMGEEITLLRYQNNLLEQRLILELEHHELTREQAMEDLAMTRETVPF
tara:strand:- start:966 stop:1181 length:216 start_codon:yes stop_codon:yes gene_type:complete